MNSKNVGIQDEIAEIDKRVVALETEIHIQFKDLYNRIKRIEAGQLGLLLQLFFYC